MNCGDVRPSHTVQCGAVVRGIGVACCAVMSTGVTEDQGKRAQESGPACGGGNVNISVLNQ
jgi:hypothetical protein